MRISGGIDGGVVVDAVAGLALGVSLGFFWGHLLLLSSLRGRDG